MKIKVSTTQQLHPISRDLRVPDLSEIPDFYSHFQLPDFEILFCNPEISIDELFTNLQRQCDVVRYKDATIEERNTSRQKHGHTVILKREACSQYASMNMLLVSRFNEGFQDKRSIPRCDKNYIYDNQGLFSQNEKIGKFLDQKKHQEGGSIIKIYQMGAGKKHV